MTMSLDGLMSGNPSVSFAHRFSPSKTGQQEEEQVRAIGLDVHRGFCEVAIVEQGEVRSVDEGGSPPICRSGLASHAA